MPSIVKQLTDEELREKNRLYLDFDTKQMGGFWDVLNEHFSSAPVSDDRKYWWSFFRWYTDLTWRDLNRLERDVFEQVAVGRQIPMAIIFGFDVWHKIMSYLAFKGLDEEGTQNLYVKIRVAFLKSQAVVGYTKGRQEIKIADLVKELTLINSRGRDSMAVAQFYEKIKNLLFPSDDKWLKEFIDTDFKAAVIKLVDLMDFFLSVEPEELSGVMDLFLYPELYPTAEPSAAPVTTPTSAPRPSAPPTPPTHAPILKEQGPKNKEQTILKPQKKAQPIKPPIPAPKPPVSPPIPAKPTKPSYADIKQKMEAVFKKDPNGEFEDLDGALNALSKLAEKYNDTKIAELYYFDEKESKFKWGMQ